MKDQSGAEEYKERNITTQRWAIFVDAIFGGADGDGTVGSRTVGCQWGLAEFRILVIDFRGNGGHGCYTIARTLGERLGGKKVLN